MWLDVAIPLLLHVFITKLEQTETGDNYDVSSLWCRLFRIDFLIYFEHIVIQWPPYII